MEQKRKLRYIIVFLLLGGCVVLLGVLNICIGSVSIPVFDIVASIQGKTVYLDTQLSGRYLYGYYGFDTEDADTLDTEFPDV